jgi:hypothetical protein
MTNTTTVKSSKPRGRPAKATRTERPTRVPLTGGSKRQHIRDEDKDPAFHYAWIDDKKDLVARAIRAGYEHVTMAEMPSWGSVSVDSADPASSVISMGVGEGTSSYLMKQPMEFWEEDIDAKHARLNKKESGMKKQLNSGQEGTYGKVDFDS